MPICYFSISKSTSRVECPTRDDCHFGSVQKLNRSQLILMKLNATATKNNKILYNLTKTTANIFKASVTKLQGVVSHQAFGPSTCKCLDE